MPFVKPTISASEAILARQVRKELKMSQSQFSSAFGIPLTTLQNWEQGRRRIDKTTVSYLRTIRRFPIEVQRALTE